MKKYVVEMDLTYRAAPLWRLTSVLGDNSEILHSGSNRDIGKPNRNVLRPFRSLL